MGGALSAWGGSLGGGGAAIFWLGGVSAHPTLTPLREALERGVQIKPEDLQALERGVRIKPEDLQADKCQVGGSSNNLNRNIRSEGSKVVLRDRGLR